jgi:hypothetical protein
MNWLNALFNDRHYYGLMFDDDNDGGDNNDDGAEITKLKAMIKQLEGKVTKLTTSLESEQGDRKELEDLLIEAAGGEEVVNYYMEHGELPDDADYDDGDDDGDDDDNTFYDSKGRIVRLVDDDEGIQGASDVESLVAGIKDRANKRIGALEKKLQQEIDKREAEETKNLEQQRDSMLAEALVKNRCVDVSAGVKLLRDNMEYDPEETTWKYKTEEGLYMEPSAGVAEQLPDYLRESALPGKGGSGSRGGQPGVAATDLEKKKEQLSALQQKATRSGDQRDVAAWQRLNREVKEIEQSQSNPA